MRRLRVASTLACMAAMIAVPSTRATSAFGDEARTAESIQRANVDTTYGRIDGDLGVSFGLGATFGPSAPRGAADLRLRYLDTAGLFVTYEDGLSATSSDPRRLVAAGFELRPLFLARWLSGREWSLARLDLFFDSLGLELGAFLEQPVGGPFTNRPGLQASLGLEVPILPSASGPWIGLHGGVRWSDAAVEGANVTDAADRSLFLMLTVAYHGIFAAHLVDVSDVAPQ
jgi:hypothetical protein